MIIVQSTENEFDIAGTGLTVLLFRNPDVDSAVGRIESDCRLQPGTGSNAAVDLGFAACAERQSRRENLQEEALSSP